MIPTQCLNSSVCFGLNGAAGHGSALPHFALLPPVPWKQLGRARGTGSELPVEREECFPPTNASNNQLFHVGAHGYGSTFNAHGPWEEGTSRLSISLIAYPNRIQF